jgi:hypothetical protein
MIISLGVGRQTGRRFFANFAEGARSSRLQSEDSARIMAFRNQLQKKPLLTAAD